MSGPEPDRVPVVEVRGLCKSFATQHGRVDAVRDVDFAIERGTTFGLAGPSAAGKTTIGRLVLDLLRPTAGEVLFEGRRIDRFTGAQRLEVAPRMQMVFQNPQASMNPRLTAGTILERPLRTFGLGSARERHERVDELLTLVGLAPRHAQYYPHEFSGGQCQRLGIARALASRPSFIFLDEPVSALDVSIQAQILNLLKDLQQEFGLTYLFVANNLSVARFICDRVAVLEAGRIVEVGDVEQVFHHPKAEMTRRLIDSIVSMGDRA
ncbi:MAG: ATP-binding cassette domain-containing protein [Azospirillaceae bacterium]